MIFEPQFDFLEFKFPVVEPVLDEIVRAKLVDQTLSEDRRKQLLAVIETWETEYKYTITPEILSEAMQLYVLVSTLNGKNNPSNA